nr:uncharacterized protein LOC101258587 isoform X1 [Solanum lycopersicum]
MEEQTHPFLLTRQLRQAISRLRAATAAAAATSPLSLLPSPINEVGTTTFSSFSPLAFSSPLLRRETSASSSRRESGSAALFPHLLLSHPRNSRQQRHQTLLRLAKRHTLVNYNNNHGYQKMYRKSKSSRLEKFGSIEE